MIADFALCACPDELIDLETFLLGSAPEGGNWIIQNPGGLDFVLLPPPGPGNSHAALYNDGCGISRVIYEYTDCNNNARRDTILVDFHRCAELEVATTDIRCQGDATFSTLTNLRGCDNYIVRVFSGLIPGGTHMTTIGAFTFPSFNLNPPAGNYSITWSVQDPSGVCPEISRTDVVTIYQKARTQIIQQLQV
ncbi:MAG: hypothetical protein V9E90_10860 [Saprospiraceae bacterium]